MIGLWEQISQRVHPHELEQIDFQRAIKEAIQLSLPAPRKMEGDAFDQATRGTDSFPNAEEPSKEPPVR
jgi:hypothetical protein